MNSKIFRTNKFIMLFVSTVLICWILCLYIVTGLFTYTNYVSKQVNNGNHYSDNNVINKTLKIKDCDKQLTYNDNFNMIEQNIFDEEFYKKRLSTYFNNSMLFAAYIGIMILSLLIVLRNDRRRYFKETHNIHFLKLMNYIHRMDGESGGSSLYYSF